MIGATGVVAASDHGFYADVGAGIARYPNDPQVDLRRTIFKRESATHQDFAWSFAAGYRFNTFLAMELGFSDLGQVHTKLVDKSDTIDARGKIDLSAKGKTLALLAHAPTGNWDPFVKVGVIESIADLRVEDNYLDTGSAFSSRSEEYKAFFGVGVRYAYTERWALSAAVDYYPVIGAARAYGATHLIAPRLGFAYRF
jgi:hypothetical protein